MKIDMGDQVKIYVGDWVNNDVGDWVKCKWEIGLKIDVAGDWVEARRVGDCVEDRRGRLR